MRIHEAGTAFMNCHAGVAEQAAVDAVQASDFAVLVLAEGRPVETRFGCRPAEALRVMEVLRVV